MARAIAIPRAIFAPGLSALRGCNFYLTSDGGWGGSAALANLTTGGGRSHQRSLLLPITGKKDRELSRSWQLILAEMPSLTRVTPKQSERYPLDTGSAQIR